MSNLRKHVLQSFKQLHRTRMKVFGDDFKTTTAARLKINEEYKKNKHVSDGASITSLLQFSQEIEKELRTQVIQAKEIKPGVFEARITQDTLKMENIPYNDAAIPPEEGDTIRVCTPSTPCCQEQDQKK